MLAIIRTLMVLMVFLVGGIVREAVAQADDYRPSGADPHLQLTTVETQFLKQHPVIRVANDRQWPPYDFYERGQARGYSMDYLRVLAKIIGIKLTFVQDSSWEHLIQQFEAKKLDVITTYEDSDAHQPYALFTAPFLRTQESIVIRKGTPVMKDYRALSGKTVAIIRGYGYETILREKFPDIHVVMVDTPVQALKMVSYSQADATIENTAVVSYLMKTHGIVNLTLAGDPKLPGLEIGDAVNIAVRKDWPELHSLLVKAMALVPETTLHQLNQNWLKGTGEKGPNLTLTQAEQAYLSRKGLIKYCTFPNAKPYEWINHQGQHQGISADFLTLFAQRLHIPFQLVPTVSWTASLANLRQGKCDILPVAVDVPSRHAVMNFTRPYLVQPFVVVTRLEGPFIYHLHDLASRPIGVVKNYAYTELLHADSPDFNAVPVRSVKDGLLKVEDEEIYGYLDSMPAVGYTMQKYAMTDLKIAGQIEQQLKICIASRKDEPLLGQIMQKAIDGLTEQEKTSVIGKWISFTYEKGTNYVLIAELLAGSLAIVFVVVWWNRKLAKSRRQAEQLQAEAERHKQQADQDKLIAQQALKALEEKTIELERIAVTDRLTGLFNRVRLEEVLKSEYVRADRFHHPLSVIIIDVDHFKKVNDTYGHTVGDTVLVSLACILQSHVRAADTIGRWGGEEFLVVACETDLKGACHLAKKLRMEIEQFTFGEVGTVTASFGVAMFRPDEQIKDLIIRADDALYQAKHHGRNRVRCLE